jgi:hypothetical protein
MLNITIGSETRKIGDADPRWIHEQVDRRRAAGERVCVRIAVHEGDVNMVLSTPGCPMGCGGGRAPNPKEALIFELWEKLHLNTERFSGGNVIAFLEQLLHALGLRKAA